jgi:plasmid replication initiation protein
MIARIQPEDEDFKPYRISLNELAEFLGINKNHIYADCKKITKKLLDKVVEIQETGRLLQTHWVSSADYVDGTGMVNLTFDPLLKPYLLQLKGNFTSSKLEMLLSFKSQYTMRMYTLLKQYERLNERMVELQQLREITATQSIIKTQQSDLQPFYSEHTLASPGLESAVLRYHGRKSVRGLLESCKG